MPIETPRFSCCRSRPCSQAKLDHRPITLPLSSASTPSKSVGPFTSRMVSRLLSRNCMVRDSGNWIGVTEATSVARTLISLSGFMPTTDNDSPGRMRRSSNLALFTGVLPMSFGTVFRTDDDIRAFLKGTYDALSDVLQKMDGKIEFGLKVNWDKDQVVREIENESEEIRRLKEEIASNTTTSTYFSRMQLGRVVESALQAKADAYVSEIYEALRDAAIASRSNKPIGDKMIMNAAFLVDREKTKTFDDQISDIAKKYENKLSFLYTGPWPPYNFVNIRLKLERP